MKVAVSGCSHGALDMLYSTIAEYEQKFGQTIDLLICCGDFECVRNQVDLDCMACPLKYRQFGDFLQYYNGTKRAPVLTVFTGGNHEASNVLRELYLGGWLAENIFYLGQSGVVRVGVNPQESIRIAGVSGIYKYHDYDRGYFELPPYDNDSSKSSCHVRRFEVNKLLQLKQPIDVMVTHDWPRGVERFGDVKHLLEMKPFFAEDVAKNQLGNPGTTELMQIMQPRFWFSGHLHVYYAATIVHPNNNVTKFLATDKPIPGRHFLHFVDVPFCSSSNSTVDSQPPIPTSPKRPNKIFLDQEWLCILKENNDNIPISNGRVNGCTRSPTEACQASIKQKLSNIQSPCFKKVINEENSDPATSDELLVEWTSDCCKDLQAQRLQLLDVLGEQDTLLTRLGEFNTRTSDQQQQPQAKLTVQWRPGSLQSALLESIPLESASIMTVGNQQQERSCCEEEELDIDI